MKKRLLLLLAGIGAVVLAVPVGEGREADGAKASAPELVRGNNRFAFDLYARLRSRRGNLFFSPYSISAALGMTYTGARGETAAEMARALHFPADPGELAREFHDLTAQLNGIGKRRPYQLSVANSLWYQRGYPLRPEFTKRAMTDFDAQVRPVDFRTASEAARRAINAWVEKKTQDKIKDLLQPGVVDQNTRLVLANAIYFKARWQLLFSEQATQKGNFHLAGGRTVRVPLMHRTGGYSYFAGDDFQLLRMPYSQGALEMVVLLPKEAGGLAELEKGLTAAKVEQWLGRTRGYEVNVTLPKFKVTSQFALRDALTGLGMRRAFTAGADFSGITRSRPLAISAVIHKAYGDVHEKGTEAAAATAVVIVKAAAPVPRPKPKATFRADHPFVFLIRHAGTGSTLFLGRVTNPQS
jgi:serpin B